MIGDETMNCGSGLASGAGAAATRATKKSDTYGRGDNVRFLITIKLS